MEIIPEHNLGSVGPVANKGLCVKIDIWNNAWMNDRPAIWDILYRTFEIAKSFDGAIKESVDLGYYGGPRIYYFPHKFYNSHPTIVPELLAALGTALKEREELILIAKQDKMVLEMMKNVGIVVGKFNPTY